MLAEEHLSEAELTRFAAGRLEGEDQARAEQHIAVCPVCCQRLESRPEDPVAVRLRDVWQSRTADEVQVEASAAIPPELLNHPRYHLRRLIGTGGMGSVYEAEHRLMERTVAIKVINPRLLDRPNALQRFEVEVKAAAKLDHPNIVRAYDAEHAGTLHFLVMEYVEGESLATLVRARGPLEPPVACQYIRQAAIGLQHAYEHGMVHRDIKPENLVLTRAEQIKILDFGLARLARQSPSFADGAADEMPLREGITAAGSVFGTPRYMAPEQARNAAVVDIRADIYSLGCTLYFLVTGTPMPENPQQRRTDLPAGVAAIMAKMTANDAGQRYQTPLDVANDLAAVVQASAGWKRIARWAAVLGLITALGAAGALLLPGSPDKRTATAAPHTTGRVVLCIVPAQYYAMDYVRVREMLERAGARVVTASTGRCEPAPGSPGPSFEPDLLVTPQLLAAHYDAVYFPGGYVHAYKDETPARAVVWRLIDQSLADHKPVAALGVGQAVLAVHGTLKDRTAAANTMMRSRMGEYARTFAEQAVADDRGIITGRDSADADAFAEALARALAARQ